MRSDPAEAPLARHTLVTVAPAAWRAWLDRRPALAAEPTIAHWAERGWPLVARRPSPGEAGGVPLGLPLPPVLGKQRLALVLQAGDVLDIRPPPTVAEARAIAPTTWRDTLDAVGALAATAGAEARVFGSLAWQAITGLPYLAPDSDCDLLVLSPRRGALPTLLDGFAALDSAAPMRLDGEVVAPDGSAVHWRELHAGADNVLVKAARAVATVGRAGWIAGLAA